MNAKPIIILLFLVQFLQCCNHTGNTSQSQAALPTRPDSIVKADTIVFSKVNVSTDLKSPWMAEWNYYISDEIKLNKEIFINKDSIYKPDILKLCPSYYQCKENEKIAFWTLVIASMAKFESNFNPNCRFKEGPPLNTYSEGLLQLSYGDETRYKNVPLDEKKQNILNPEVNLRTGVIILAKQLEVKKSIFTSKYFYWSVLKNKQNEIIKFFKDNAAELNICK